VIREATRSGCHHNLHHSGVTFLIKHGEQTRTIMQIVGHRSAATTAR
jgi:site-specific recombinase XerD